MVQCGRCFSISVSFNVVRYCRQLLYTTVRSVAIKGERGTLVQHCGMSPSRMGFQGCMFSAPHRMTQERLVGPFPTITEITPCMSSQLRLKRTRGRREIPDRSHTHDDVGRACIFRVSVMPTLVAWVRHHSHLQIHVGEPRGLGGWRYPHLFQLRQSGFLYVQVSGV